MPTSQRGGSLAKGETRVFCKGGQSFISRSQRSQGLSIWEDTQAKGLNVENIKVLQGQLCGVVDSPCNEGTRGATEP